MKCREKKIVRVSRSVLGRRRESAKYVFGGSEHVSLRAESHWGNFGSQCSYPTGTGMEGSEGEMPALVTLWKKATPRELILC